MKMKSALVTLCFLLGFLGGTAGKLVYEANTFLPYEWRYDPIVINCVGEDLSEKSMIRAIHYWTIRGHNIEWYEHDPPEEYCQSDYIMPGFIVIRKSRFMELGPSTLATTTREVSGLKINGAEIVFKRSSLGLELVYIHELGHAMGYGHVEIRNHIMHPTYEYMGDVFFIP